jgi:hypothetical protein
MPTIKIKWEVVLELDLFHSKPEPDSGYRGCTEIETVRLADPEGVIREINKLDSDELMEAAEL